MKRKSLLSPDYAAFLAEVKGRIQTARIAAGRAVSRELAMLYWEIGRGIVERQEQLGWGDAVVECLAADLRAEFPNTRGFSNNSVWLMRQLYAEYSTPEFLERLVQELKRRSGSPILEQAVQESLAQATLELIRAVRGDITSN